VSGGWDGVAAVVVELDGAPVGTGPPQPTTSAMIAITTARFMHASTGAHDSMLTVLDPSTIGIGL
jgi:hypothetical protein